MVYRYPLGYSLHPEALKEKQRSLREGFQTPLAFRVHRALSWLRRAEAEDRGIDPTTLGAQRADWADARAAEAIARMQRRRSDSYASGVWKPTLFKVT